MYGRFFCWIFARFDTNCRRSALHTWITSTNIRPNRIDMQEINSRVAQQDESEICSVEAGLRMEGLPALHCGLLFLTHILVPMPKETLRAQMASVIRYPIPIW